MNTKDYLHTALEKSRESLAELVVAQETLAASSNDDPHYRLLIDATIKRFEVCFEYLWKLLKLGSEYQGVEAPGPRPAIREAVRFRWLDDPQLWADALDARNGSVHDYFGISEAEYLKLIARFITSADTVIEHIESL